MINHVIVLAFFFLILKGKGNNNMFNMKVILKFKFGTNLEFFFDLEFFKSYSISFALCTY